jgi:hypothetical protein
MELNLVLPFFTTVIMLIFVIIVFRRYLESRKLHFLFWGIGLAMFGAASFAEAYLALSWSPWVFFIWYIFGATLTAAWIGHGTLLLLIRKRWAHMATLILVLASLFAALVLVNTLPILDTEVFNLSIPISEQYRTNVIEPGETIGPNVQIAQQEIDGEQVAVQRGLLPLGSSVRRNTILFNIYGTLTLVGGAIWSAYLFWRKRVLPNRVLGNVLIAAGALLIAFASTLTRLGYGQFLYLAELLSAVIMFAGFLVTSKPQTETGKAS